jgi:hypothetical protein
MDFYEINICKLVIKWIHFAILKIVKKFTLLGITYEVKDANEYEHEGYGITLFS